VIADLDGFRPSNAAARPLKIDITGLEESARAPNIGRVKQPPENITGWIALISPAPPLRQSTHMNNWQQPSKAPTAVLCPAVRLSDASAKVTAYCEWALAI
jgi:hypothetical protein